MPPMPNDSRPALQAPSPGLGKTMGAVLIVVGAMMALSGLAVMVLVLPEVAFGGPERLLVQAMPFTVVAFGAVSVANGVHMARHGRWNQRLRVAFAVSGLGGASLFLVFSLVLFSL